MIGDRPLDDLNKFIFGKVPFEIVRFKSNLLENSKGFFVVQLDTQLFRPYLNVVHPTLLSTTIRGDS